MGIFMESTVVSTFFSLLTWRYPTENQYFEEAEGLKRHEHEPLLDPCWVSSNIKFHQFLTWIISVSIPSFVRFPFEAMSKTHLSVSSADFSGAFSTKQSLLLPWKNRPSFVTKAASLGSVALAGLLVVPLRALEVSNDEVSILRWKKGSSSITTQKRGWYGWTKFCWAVQMVKIKVSSW